MASSIETTSTTTTLKNNGTAYISVDTNENVTLAHPLALAQGGSGAVSVNGLVQMVYTQTGALATGTGAIPQDDTIPQITEGTEFMTRTITPKHASNLLQIDVVLYCGQSADTTTQMALFVGTTANALAAVATDAYSTRQEVPTLRHIVVAGATSELTFRVRASGSSGTISFNGQGGGRRFGGVAGSSITITEYSV